MSKLILLWGIRRSGNSAVRNWLAYQFETAHCQTNANTIYFNNGFNPNDLEEETWTLPNAVVSFEEQPLQTKDWNYQALSSYYKEHHRLVLLRDPYNTFASRIKHYDLMSVKGTWIDVDNATFCWRQYANAYLENPSEYILYNHFIEDEEYRKEICERVGGTYSDDTLPYVDDPGGGSSFDGRLYNGRAQEMKVFNRWEEYADNAAFRALFTPEIRQLSKEIFDYEPI